MNIRHILITLSIVSTLLGCTTLQPNTPTVPETKHNRENTNITPKPTYLPPKRIVPQEENEEPTLYHFTDCDSGKRPEKGIAYNHTHGDIRVFQVIKEKVNDSEKELTWVLARGDSLCIGVINDREYVNGESLLKGKYRYIGPVTYETAPIIDGVKSKGTNTVRLFVEVDSGFDKAYLESQKE
jgi:hypothetical protein